jgi:hypothetical protein
LTFPEHALVQTFRCNSCDTRWSTPLPSCDGFDHVCRYCQSRDLAFIEHTGMTAIYQCNECQRVVGVRIDDAENR